MSLKGGTFVVNELNKVLKRIDELKEYAVELLKELIRAKAVNPSFGGPGEYRRGKYLKEVLSELGLKVTSYDVKDERAEGGIRPNIIATLKGQEERKLWLVSHLDTVPEGDRGLWSSDPYEPLMIGDKIYGRGSEDNCQAIVSSILVAKALIDSNITPKLSLGLIMASDEEAGSKYGIERVLDELKPVNKGDLIVVPDAGEPNGDFIEVAEKSILWFKVITLGKQGHASLPSEALNAHRVGMKFCLALDALLHERFNAVDPLFIPPTSTFEPTRKEENVGNVNTIPGKDVIYFDCRILPVYKINQVLRLINDLKPYFEKAYGVKIKIEVVQKAEAPPPTDPNSEVVVRLKRAIKIVKGVEAKVGGIGGGTFAASFRRRGYGAAVWSTVDKTAHKPNEYCKLSNVIGDAKVFATMLFL